MSNVILGVQLSISNPDVAPLKCTTNEENDKPIQKHSSRASQRRRRNKENKPKAGNLRAAVEATVRSVKLPFPEAQLPVRGKFRITCMLIGSAAVANVRRIERYLQARLKAEIKEKTAQSQQGSAQDAIATSIFGSVRGFFARLLNPRLVFMPTSAGF